MVIGSKLRRKVGCEQYAIVRARVVGGTEVLLLGPHHYGGTMVIPHDDLADWETIAELPASAEALGRLTVYAKQKGAKGGTRSLSRYACSAPETDRPGPDAKGPDGRVVCPVCGRHVGVTPQGRYARHRRPAATNSLG